MKQIYTIGHSNHEMEKFLHLLKMHGINYVLDVRSNPYSRYTSWFNRENLEKELSGNGINYSFMGKYFGARQEDKRLYNDSGYLDFERVRESDGFKKGVANVMLGLNQGNDIALMCTEKDPMDCHRAILVARGFELAGINVSHILENGELQSQDMLNKRLLDKYFPDRNQMSVFDFLDNSERSDDDNLKEAYRIRNSEIGYRFETSNEFGGM